MACVCVGRGASSLLSVDEPLACFLVIAPTSTRLDKNKPKTKTKGRREEEETTTHTYIRTRKGKEMISFIFIFKYGTCSNKQQHNNKKE